MTSLGVFIGLTISIIFILRRFHPVYALILGSLVAGIIGGFSVNATINIMISGIKTMVPAIIRILTAGILVGTLIKTGAAIKIAETIIEKLGEKFVLLALTLATFCLTATGIFLDVTIITIAPIALTIAQKLNISKSAILLALSGGGKAGNLISPNPSTIAVSEIFQVPISSVMAANILPSIIAIALTAAIAKFFINKGEKVTEDPHFHHGKLPSFTASIIGPVTAILLLTLQPLFQIAVDPLIALPIGGILGIIAMGKLPEFNSCLRIGLEKVSGVVLLLTGVGTMAGMIQNSNIKELSLQFLETAHISDFFIAPLSGIFLAMVTASATAGATIASTTFVDIIINTGIAPVQGASLINAGSMVMDHMPHGSFFHNTKDAFHLSLKERFRVFPYEILIGFSLIFSAVIRHFMIN